MSPEESRTAGPLRSTGVTPLPRYYGPVRHPLAFPRLRHSPKYLAPTISRRDEEGFSSCLSHPCHRADAATPSERFAVTRRGRPVLLSPQSRRAQPPRLVTFGASFTFTSLRPGGSHASLKRSFVDGLQLIRFPSWLPSTLQGFWLLPRWDCLPLCATAFVWTHRPS